MSFSIQKRSKTSYLVTVSMGFDHHGKRKRRTRTIHAKNITEARRQGSLFVAELESKAFIENNKIKYHELTDLWWKRVAVRELASSTQELYSYILKKYLIPDFGEKLIQDFKPIDITDYLQGLENRRLDGGKGGLATSTIEKHWILLTNTFDFAVKNEWLSRNPTHNAEKPRVVHAKSEVYTMEEVKKLYELLNDVQVHNRLMIKLAIDVGLRRSEILALEWKDINFKTQTINIYKSLSYTKNKGYEIKSTKTEEERVVVASEYLIKELEEYYLEKKLEKKLTNELWKGGKYFFIFSNWDGKPFNPSSVTTWWSRFIKRTGFKRIRLHDLRHTSATLLIGRGVHAKVIAERLGHSDIKTTMNTYGHYVEDADRKAATFMDEMFGEQKKGGNLNG